MFKDLVPHIYIPDFVPTKGKLVEFKEEFKESEISNEILSQVSPLAQSLLSDEIPTKITPAEAIAIQEELSRLKTEVKETRERLKFVISRIDSLVSNSDDVVSFKIDVSKRPQLKRALQKAFKTKSNTISFEMYKAALEAKKELEHQETSEYLRG